MYVLYIFYRFVVAGQVLTRFNPLYSDRYDIDVIPPVRLD